MMRRSILFLAISVFIGSCSFDNHKNQKQVNKLIEWDNQKWHIERKIIDASVLDTLYHEESVFNLMDYCEEKSTILLFTPATVCFLCYSPQYEYLMSLANRNNIEVIVLCERSNQRACMQFFYNHLVLGYKTSNPKKNTSLEVPFIYFYTGGIPIGLLILEKDNYKMRTDNYFEFWLN
jgi:hypothetical protein